MSGPWGLIVKTAVLFERTLVNMLLRSPSFHTFVRRIHRAVEDRKYGRDPNEPLRPGEATEEPRSVAGQNGFFKYFAEEIWNQAKGKPTSSEDGTKIDAPRRPKR